MDILFGAIKVGEVIHAGFYSTNKVMCLAELKMDDTFSIKSNMRFLFKKVLVGDPYLEIIIDSAKTMHAIDLSTSDTLICNN
jgi:hypothetical protein